MKYYLTLFLILSLLSCNDSLRNQWRDRVKQNNARIKDITEESSETLAIKLTEFEASLTVSEAQKVIEKHEKNLTKAQMALHDEIKAIEALGLLYLNNKFYLPALEQFERALELHPTSAVLHYHAGLSSGWLSNTTLDNYQQANWRAKAIAHLKRASELDPSHAPSTLALATLYSEDSNTLNEAKIELKRYRSIYPDSLDAKLIEANIAFKERNFSFAQNLYQQIIMDKESALPQNKFLLKQANHGLEMLRQ